jgi:anti-sigma factor RsiW
MSDASAMRHIDEHIAAYTAGELSDEATAQVERHLAECPRCQTMLAETRHICTLLSALVSDGDEIPPVAARVKAALRAEEGESPAP